MMQKGMIVIDTNLPTNPNIKSTEIEKTEDSWKLTVKLDKDTTALLMQQAN